LKHIGGIMRLIKLLVLGISLMALPAWADQLTLAQVKTEYTKASKPSASALLGSWFAVGLATPDGGQYTQSGLEGEPGQLLWTLNFKMSSKSLTVLSNFSGTVPQIQKVIDSNDSIGFAQGFDTDLKFILNCRLSASSILLCLDPSENLGVEFAHKAAASKPLKSNSLRGASQEAKLDSLPKFSDIVRNADGSIRLMAQSSEYMKSINQPLPTGELGALEYCASQGMHLPSARELAQLSQSMGAKGIGAPPEKITSGITAMDVDGNLDRFSFDKTGYVPPVGDFGKNSFWSSSTGKLTDYLVYVLSGDNGDIVTAGREMYKFVVICVSSR